MAFAFGDIYHVQFDPSVGREYKGRRPGFIVQEEKISSESSLVSVVPLTSQLEKRRASDILIQKNSKNRLALDSLIKVHHISTFDKNRFIHFIGKAGSPVIRQVRGHLRRHFGL